MSVQTEDLTAPGPGSITLTMGERQVRARHAHESGIDSFSGTCGGCDLLHQFVTICFTLDTTAPPTRAIYVSLTPEQARSYAAALLETASQLDGGASVQ